MLLVYELRYKICLVCKNVKPNTCTISNRLFPTEYQSRTSFKQSIPIRSTRIIHSSCWS